MLTAYWKLLKRQQGPWEGQGFHSESLCLQQKQICSGWGMNFNFFHVKREGQTEGSKHKVRGLSST